MLHSHLGLHYWCARQYDLAIQTLNGAEDIEPGNAYTHFFLGRCYEKKQLLDEAIAEHEKSVALSRVPQNLGGLGLIYARAHKRDKALEILKELEAWSEKSYVSPCYLALICFELNDTEKAFKWLERAYENRDAELVYLKADPQFDGFRSDPKFQELTRLIGLP
jgi:tetratricopeptide (TPR) repeat protein